MLSSLIGVILAFITVMLLLSLVVMALVQLTQATLRLRSRNLIVGISALLKAEGVTPAAPAPERWALRRQVAAQRAAEVLNATTPATIRPVADPNSWRNVIRGPAAAWVDPHDLARAIVGKRGVAPAKEVAAESSGSDKEPKPINTIKEPDPAEKQLADKFRALEPAMSDRFARTMQMWTSVWAIGVAIVFQVSTPTLLTTLSTSEAKREAVIAMVPSVLQQAESSIPAAMSDDFVDRALQQLAQTYPSHQDLFDQVSGSVDSREEMLDELRAVLAGVPERDAIVARYAQIIDNTTAHDVRTALATATGAIDSLEVIDIRPWGKGGSFYLSASNIIGVLITAILLSFGAPFWFEQLKNVASLKDALSKNKPVQADLK